MNLFGLENKRETGIVFEFIGILWFLSLLLEEVSKNLEFGIYSMNLFYKRKTENVSVKYLNFVGEAFRFSLYLLEEVSKNLEFGIHSMNLFGLYNKRETKCIR